MKRIAVVLVVLLGLGTTGLAVYWKGPPARWRRLSAAEAGLGTQPADALLERLTREDPDDPRVLFLQARQFRLKGKVEAAVVWLQRAADRGWPGDQVERERLLLQAQIDFGQAEPELQDRLNYDPDDREVLLALAFGYLQREQYFMAATLTDRILDRLPEDGPTLCLRGAIRLKERKDLNQAREDLEKAVAVGRDQVYVPEARIMLANCLLGLGRFEEAAKVYQECRVESPENFMVLYRLGRCLVFLNRYDQALEVFQAALAVRPGHPDTLLQTAAIYEQQKDFARALDVLEQVEHQEPNLPEMLFRMAKVLAALGQAARADEYQKRYDARGRNEPALSGRPEEKHTLEGSDQSALGRQQ